MSIETHNDTFSVCAGVMGDIDGSRASNPQPPHMSHPYRSIDGSDTKPTFSVIPLNAFGRSNTFIRLGTWSRNFVLPRTFVTCLYIRTWPHFGRKASRSIHKRSDPAERDVQEDQRLWVFAGWNDNVVADA